MDITPSNPNTDPFEGTLDSSKPKLRKKSSGKKRRFVWYTLAGVCALVAAGAALALLSTSKPDEKKSDLLAQANTEDSDEVIDQMLTMVDENDISDADFDEAADGEVDQDITPTEVDDTPEPAPVASTTAPAAQPAPAAQSPQAKAPARSSAQVPEKQVAAGGYYRAGYTDPADGGYVPGPRPDRPEVRYAGRSEGLDYNPDKFANGPLPSGIKHPTGTEVYDHRVKSSRIANPADAVKIAVSNGDYAEVMRMANSGQSAAYGAAAKYLLRTGDYQQAEQFALKAQAAGLAEGDEVIKYLRNTGYYD